MLEFVNVRKSFGKKEVFRDLNLNIEKSQSVAILGPNGVGKTVFIELILKLIYPTSGVINRDFDIKTDIGLMEQNDSFPDHIKVNEFLNINQAYFNNIDIPKRNLLIKELGLDDKKNIFINKLSGGQKRKLTFIASIINNPKLLLLDEPTTGMDFESCKNFWNKISELKRNNNTTMIITLHHLDELNEYCDRFIFLKEGKVVKDIYKADIKDEFVYVIDGSNQDLNYLCKNIGGYLHNNQLIISKAIDRTDNIFDNLNIKINKRILQLKDIYEQIYNEGV